MKDPSDTVLRLTNTIDIVLKLKACTSDYGSERLTIGSCVLPPSSAGRQPPPMRLLNPKTLIALLLLLGSATTTLSSTGQQEVERDDLEISQAAYKSGDFTAALDAARRAALLDPNRGNAAAARALGSLGAWPPAESAARAALAVASTPDNALLLAWTLQQQDQPEAALAEIERAMVKAPAHAILEREAALLLLKLGQPEPALRLLTNTMGAGQQVDPGVLGLILAALPDGRGDAVEQLHKALETNASSVVPVLLLRRELGTLLSDLGRTADAVGHLQWTYDQSPQDSDLAYRLALAYRELGQADDARAMLEEFQRLRSTEDQRDAAQRSTGAALNEAQELAASDQLDDALSKIDTVLAAYPSSFSAHALRAKVLYSQRKIEQALVAIRKARDLRPGLVEFHYLEGLFARTAGSTDDARLALERALSLDPNLAEAHAILGGILLESGEAQASLEHFDRAIELGASGEQIERARRLALERSGVSPQ